MAGMMEMAGKSCVSAHVYHDAELDEWVSCTTCHDTMLHNIVVGTFAIAPHSDRC